MAWTTVGYHAMEQKFFDELISKDADACILPSLSFASWYRTPLCAISQTRKEIRRVGFQGHFARLPEQVPVEGAAGASPSFHASWQVVC